MFNESDPHTLDRLLKALKGKNHSDSEVRLLLDSICKLSYSDEKNISLTPRLLFRRFKEFLMKSAVSKMSN